MSVHQEERRDNMIPEGKSRIIITLSDNLLKNLTDYADEVGITKSAAISVLLSQQFQQMESLKTLKTVTDIMESEKASNKTTA